MTTIESIGRVTRRLTRLGVAHAFLGGAVVPLLVDDPEVHHVRPTKDVDALVQVVTLAEYSALEQRLREDGFIDDRSEGAPICRYLVEGCKVDIMPISSAAIGLRSRWFPEALASAVLRPLGAGEVAPVILPGFFLATKLEAFKDRGHGDYQASHDLEDFLAVIDGCGSIIDQIASGPEALREYLAQECRNLLKNNAFRDALPGHLPGGMGDQARLPLLEARLTMISTLGDINERA